jgi:hypothetical protein
MGFARVAVASAAVGSTVLPVHECTVRAELPPRYGGIADTDKEILDPRAALEAHLQQQLTESNRTHNAAARLFRRGQGAFHVTVGRRDE